MAGPGVTYLKQLTEIWARLQPAQRLTIIVFALLVATSLGFLIFFMNRVEYEVLYRDLNPEDAQAIAGKLKDEKRDYLVQGTSILVAAPKADVDKLRLEIAGSGLARSGRVGYEIFDKSQWGMTDFTEQVNLQRALEGELARTISSLSEISQARVHIVLSKDSLFEEKKEEAKASVAVRLKNGVELSKSSIAGIKGLVAGAVPGLRSYNVSIVDDEGKLLSNSAGSGEGGREELESGIRESLEKEMVNKVVSILEPVVGKGKVHANASIDLDFNSTEQTEESFNPSPTVILSQQKSEERVGGATAVSGVPGTQSNTSGSQPQASGTTPERTRQSELTNYEVSKLVRHTVQPKGTVRRVSVAVILDHKAVYKKESDGKVTTTYQPRTQSDLDAYRELVLAAVGYDKERGDTVTLENVPFFYETRPEEDHPPAPWYVKWQAYLLPAIKYTAFMLLFVLVYFTLFRPIRRRVFQSISASTPALAAHGEVAEIAAGAGGKAIPGATSAAREVSSQDAIAALPGAEEGASGEPELSLESIDDQIEREFLKEAQVVDVGARKYVLLRKKLTEQAQREPEVVSQLVRSWLHERE